MNEEVIKEEAYKDGFCVPTFLKYNLVMCVCECKGLYLDTIRQDSHLS